MMGTDIQIFERPEFGKLRITLIDGEPWFVGKDVAGALGYKDTKKAIRDHVEEEDRKKIQLLDFQVGGKTPPTCESGTYKNQGVNHLKGVQVVLINESGFYSLVLSSKLPSAKLFKHWVTSEVLPSIRKTGQYRKNHSKQENPRMFVKEGIGSLTAGIFDGGEVYVMAEDVFAILGVHEAQEKESLLEQYPVINLLDSTKSYSRMIFVPFGSKEKQIMLCPAAVVGLFMQSGSHSHWNAAGWLLSEIIPELKGEKAVADGASGNTGTQGDSLFSLLADACKIDDRHLRRAMAEKICRLKETIN